MRFRDSGSGPAVLLLHGCPGTPASLEPLVGTLALRRRVLLPELPGYGASPALKGVYSFARVAAMLEDELLSRGIHDVAVIGHSAGGYRALALALDAKRLRVTHVVTLAGLAGLDADARPAFAQFAVMARSGIDFRPMWLGRMTGPGFAERFPDRALEVMSWIDAAPRGVLAGELEAFAAADDLRPRLGELSVPVTARVGEMDAATPAVCSEQIAAGAPLGELELVKACGHALLHEDREATVAAVVRALER